MPKTSITLSCDITLYRWRARALRLAHKILPTSAMQLLFDRWLHRIVVAEVLIGSERQLRGGRAKVYRVTLYDLLSESG